MNNCAVARSYRDRDRSTRPRRFAQLPSPAAPPFAFLQMIRLLALVSFVYQSAAAVILIIALSHILAPAEYTTFSLALASSQLLSVLVFEWLQLAGLRFLAAAKGDDAARLRWSLFAVGLLSAVALVSIGSVASLASPLVAKVGGLGLAIAVLQGLTDLYFMVVRVSDRLGTAALLLILRASLLLVGASAGAYFFGTTQSTLFGVVFGHATALIAGVIAHRTPLQQPSRAAMLRHWADFCRYGMLAAGASVIHLSVPVVIRFVVIGRLGAAGLADSAGFSMAIDLLQRPFTVLVAAIHTVNYPEVVVQYERGTDHDARQSTIRLFDFILCATIVMLGGIIGFLPDAGRLFVPADLRASFLEAAPSAAVFYFLHTHLQATLAVIPHLRKTAIRLVVVAACQFVLVALLSILGAALRPYPAVVISGAATATATIILFACGPIMRFGAFPRWPMVAEAVCAAVFIGAFSIVPSEPVWLMSKIAVSAFAVGIVTWRGDFLMLKQRLG